MRSKALLGLCLLLLPLPALAGAVQEVRGSAGITAWVAEEHTQPLISLRIAFKNAGSAQDPDGKEGRAQLAAELLPEGAGSHDALTLNTLLEEHAIKLSVDADDDMLTLTLDTLSEHRDLAFALLGDILTRPRFDQDALARARRAALTGLKQSRQDPDWLLARAVSEAAFHGHPYARDAQGTEASLKALRREDFVTYAKRYLTRENMVISVAGDITPEMLSSLLDKHLSALPAGLRQEAIIPEVEIPAKGVQRVVPLDIPQTMVAFVLPGLKREDADYITAYVMNYVIGGATLTSRLGREIREKRGLAYGASTQLSPQFHAATLMGGFSTRSAQAGEAAKVMRQTLADIAANGVTEAELDDAKRFLTGSFVMGLDTNRELAGMMQTMQIHGLGKDYMDSRNAKVNAVTREQVNRMAARLLALPRMIVVMVGKPEGVEHAE